VLLRLKVEINTREHFSVFDVQRHAYEVESRWFTGRAHIATFELDELLATKLRALYQRKKGSSVVEPRTIPVILSEAKDPTRSRAKPREPRSP
jgi:hypothetical protein